MVEQRQNVQQRFGNYYLLSLLGKGNYASVYHARHAYLQTEAAVKVLHARLVAEYKDHFRHEAEVVAQLQHPHIIQLLDYGIERGTPYLVTTFAPQGTLRQRYPSGTRVPLKDVLSFVQQIAEALHYAHQRRLIHRDIKPENILLGAQGEILLGDFGIATIIESSTHESMQSVLGTALYMAPEQARGYPGSASDQYALAVMVYEWLSGAPPFRGSLIELAYQHQVEPVPSLAEAVPELPPDVVSVVEKALAKDPNERFSSVEAFARALTQAAQPPEPVPLLAETLSPTHPSSTSLSPTVPPSKRLELPSLSPSKEQPRSKRKRLLLASVFLLVLLFLGGSSFFLLRQPSRPPTPLPPTSAVPTPTPPKSQLLYQSTTFQDWKAPSGWQLQKGQILALGDTIEDVIFAPYQPSTPDYAVEVDIQIINMNLLGISPTICDAGLLVHATPGKEPGDYTGYVGAQKIADEAFLALVQGSTTSESHYGVTVKRQHDTAFHHYRLEVRGSTLTFLIDGQKIASFQDAQYAQPGKIGLWGRSVKATFKQFRVFSL